jgi:hypothetical protein
MRALALGRIFSLRMAVSCAELFDIAVAGMFKPPGQPRRRISGLCRAF